MGEGDFLRLIEPSPKGGFGSLFYLRATKNVFRSLRIFIVRVRARTLCNG